MTFGEILAHGPGWCHGSIKMRRAWPWIRDIAVVDTMHAFGKWNLKLTRLFVESEI